MVIPLGKKNDKGNQRRACRYYSINNNAFHSIYLSSNNKDWSVSIETVKNKYSPRTSRYYIELESDKNKSITYEEYKDTEINDKIYVVKNKSGKILKTYVVKKYKYVGNNLNK